MTRKIPPAAPPPARTLAPLDAARAAARTATQRVELLMRLREGARATAGEARDEAARACEELATTADEDEARGLMGRWVALAAEAREADELEKMLGAALVVADAAAQAAQHKAEVVEGEVASLRAQLAVLRDPGAALLADPYRHAHIRALDAPTLAAERERVGRRLVELSGAA